MFRKKKEEAEDEEIEYSWDKNEKWYNDTTERIKIATEKYSDKDNIYGMDQLKEMPRKSALKLLLDDIENHTKYITKEDYETLGIEYHIVKMLKVIEKYRELADWYKKTSEDINNKTKHSRIFTQMMRLNGSVRCDSYVLDGIVYKVYDVIYNADTGMIMSRHSEVGPFEPDGEKRSLPKKIDPVKDYMLYPDKKKGEKDEEKNDKGK